MECRGFREHRQASGGAVMSKAFTREDSAPAEQLPDTREALLPPGVKNYMTPHGAEQIRLELARLQNEERPGLERLAAAADSSDRDALKQAADAKQRLRAVERHIRYLNG